MRQCRYIYLILLLLLGSGSLLGQGIQYGLTLQVLPEGTGSVTGTGMYAAGATVNLRTSASYNYFKFKSWNEGNTVISTSANFSFTMPERACVLTAVYEYNPGNPEEPNAFYQVNLNLQVSPKGAGSVSGAGKYDVGTNRSIYASASTGFRFQSWNEGDSIVATSSSYSYKVPARDVNLTAVFTYDPNSPGEPQQPNIKVKSSLFVEAQPKAGGFFNITSGTKYEEGQSVYLYAHTNSGFRFVEWRDGEEVISTNQNFYYTKGSSNKTLTAVYNYDPGNPSEPGVPPNIEHGLIALTQYGDNGQNILFPVYLLNHNISVHSVEFDITFPGDVTVDYENAVLSARKNGHAVAVTVLGDSTFHYSIQSDPQADFSGSNGVLMNIPLILPATWSAEDTYPVRISNVVMGTPGDTVSSTAHQGALGVTGVIDNSVTANFYSNMFLNRVAFINLSTETATGFEWDFGDGTISREKNPLHIFASGGVYNVKLTAYNDFQRDSITVPVNISPENTWMLSGTFSLNAHKQDLKNFTSLRELFLMLSSASIDGNITVNVEAGETFEWSLLPGEESQFAQLLDKLTAGNNKLTFQKDGTAVADPVIHFTGDISAQGYSALIHLSERMKTDRVEIKILEQTVDLQQIFAYLPQRICSGTKSEPVDFTAISEAFTCDWSLAVTPASISGYTVYGSGSIPEMNLLNTSTRTDSLSYRVSIMYTPPASSPVELYSWEYRIVVLPALQGELNLLTPTEGQVLSSSTVSLSWNAVTNAVYDLYIYEEYDDEPATPTVSQVRGTTYQSSALFRYGVTYRCKVVAYNECSRIESEMVSFTVRMLPNLHVASIGFPEDMKAGSEIEVSYRIKNDGRGATLDGEYWNNRVGIVQDMKKPASIYWLAEKGNKSALAAGGSYLDTIKVTLPERMTGNAYLVVTCNMGNILSIDWSQVGDTVPVPYTPGANQIPYPYLKSQTAINNSRVPEEGETSTITDNFFYSEIGINVQKLPDLRVVSVEIPDSAVEMSSFTVEATISNAGEAAVSGKRWTDGIYSSKSSVFNPATAILAAVSGASYDLEPGESYQAVFQVSAPVDSLAGYYYFVAADINDDVYESDNGNNRLAGDSILILPSMMDEGDYWLLKSVFDGFGGAQWKNKWNTAAPRIGNYWHGVTFENGRVTAISLPGNLLTGELTDDFLKFPYLTALNLNDNRLTGSLSDLLAGEPLSVNLAALNLGKNQLTGTVPAAVSKLTALTDLDLSYNRLSGMEQALPEAITGLNLQNQTLDRDSVILSSHPVLNIPSIALYNHTEGNFDSYPSYSLYDNANRRIFGYVPESDGQYKWDITPVNERRLEWKFDSGIEFTLVQETGLAKGSSRALKVVFAAGDANIDNSVNILDVQHTLNYIFREHVSSFNFAAADTYKDNAITVQDLVKTIQLVLTGDGGSSLRSGAETNNMLSVENGQLVLFTEEAVAAVDIRFEGVLEKDFSPLMDDSEFQFVFNDSETGTRLILISFSRDVIPPGRTVIAGINSQDAALVGVTASDIDARPVPIRISSVSTGIIYPESDGFRVFAENDIIYCELPQKADQVIATLYNLQGMAVGKLRLTNVPAGRQPLIFNVGNYPNGYILNLVIESGGQSISKNSKLLLKK